MNDLQRVATLEPQLVATSWLKTPDYEFPPGWRGWAAKRLVESGKRLGARERITGSSFKYQELTLDRSRLIECLRYWQMSIDQIVQERAKWLLVGRQEQVRLFAAAADSFHAFGPLAIPYHIPNGRKLSETRILVLRVVCVPWMEGVLILPDLETLE